MKAKCLGKPMTIRSPMRRTRQALQLPLQQSLQLLTESHEQTIPPAETPAAAAAAGSEPPPEQPGPSAPLLPPLLPLLRGRGPGMGACALE